MKKITIRFSNKQIDLSARSKLVKDLNKANPIYRPDPHWEKGEKDLLSFFSTSNNFFENHLFESKDRIGIDKRNIDRIDPLGIHNIYSNYSYLPFTRAIDHMNKIVILYQNLKKTQSNYKNRLYVLEIGGGYGRQALFFLNYFGKRVCYINVDAVPTGILTSEHFLRKNCRQDIKIASLSEIQKIKESSGKIDFTMYNYVSLPAWYIDLLPNNFFEIALNIWSMQEMSLHHEKLYFDLFMRTCKKNSILFFLNRDKLHFIDGFHFPKDWLFLFEGNEETYGNPERFFVIKPTNQLKYQVFKKYPKELIIFLMGKQKSPLTNNFQNLTATLNFDAIPAI